MVKFTVLKRMRVRGEVKADVGDTLYKCILPDYGNARNDTAATGIMHISCTKDRNGDYPTFTMPITHLQVID